MLARLWNTRTKYCLLFNPVSDDDTKDVQSKLNGHELTTRGMFGSLSSPDRNDGVQHAGAPSVDETSADHPGVVLSRGLKSCTDDCPSSANPDCLDTAITVTKGTTNKTSHEGTKIVNGNDASLKKGVINNGGACDGICVTEFHDVVVVVWCGIDTAHHTLIITEEENRQGGDTIDGNEKLSLLEFVDHIGSRDEIHGSDRWQGLSSAGGNNVIQREDGRLKTSQALGQRPEV